MTTGIRVLHPSLSKFAGYRAAQDICGGYSPPPQPTAALPGSPEKVEAMAERAAQLVSLWHPADGRME